MKSNTKSSITLPPAEVMLINGLMRRLGARTKVEVVRRGLKLLKETTDRSALRNAYSQAAMAVRDSTLAELAELDSLSAEGLGGEGPNLAQGRFARNRVAGTCLTAQRLMSGRRRSIVPARLT